MRLRLLAFTDRGLALAERLAEALEGTAERCGAAHTLDSWTAEGFREARALVFVGAAGIAVRAVAPYVKSKTSDPAVVVVDEGGRFAVPILSGHLGGANDLARRIAALCGAVPVITTATDVGGVFAVDEWAKRQGCQVADSARIKAVSGALLAGKPIRVYSPWPIAGEAPPGVTVAVSEAACDVCLTLGPGPEGVLRLVPRIAVLGIGCRKDAPQTAIETALSALLAQSGLDAAAVRKVCSIDLKRREPGLLAFCAAHGWPLETFSAEDLRSAEGDFAPSDFVRRVTGVDNVCERSAVLGSGGGGLLVKKQVLGGVTMAAALVPFAPDWRWQDG